MSSRVVRNNPFAKRPAFSKLLIGIGVVFILALSIGYRSRGWLRKTVFPAVTSVITRHSLHTATRESILDLQAAGIVKKRGTNSRRTTGCSLSEAMWLYTVAVCESYMKADLAVQSDSGLKRAVEQLQSRGWTINAFHTPSDTDDYYDRVQAAGQRDYNSTTCILILIAKPQGIDNRALYEGTATLNCYRTVSVF